MNIRRWAKLICLAGAAFLAPFVASPDLPFSTKAVMGLIGAFTTVNGFLDTGVAEGEAEAKAALIEKEEEEKNQT